MEAFFLSPATGVPAIIFTFLTITSVVATIASHWSKVNQSQLDAELKQQMLQQGMSAEEIVRVIEATPNGRNFTRKKERCGSF